MIHKKRNSEAAAQLLSPKRLLQKISQDLLGKHLLQGLHYSNNTALQTALLLKTTPFKCFPLNVFYFRILLDDRFSKWSDKVIGTTLEVSVFGVILVCIFPHSDWIQKALYLVRMRENANQNNSEYGHFLSSEVYGKL